MSRSKSKPRLGRPPRAGVAASERIEIRVTPEQRELWTAHAERECLSLTEWIQLAAATEIARRA